MENQEQHKERKHAVISGSNIYIRMNCTGSAFLSKDIPSLTNKAADRGTLAHEASETILKSFLDYKINGVLPKFSFNEEVDEEIIEWAEGYKDVIWKHVLNESITGKAYGIETKISVSEKYQMYGFTDFWCAYIDDRGKRVLAICDLKTGYVEVEVEKNPQLAFYSDALVQEIESRGKKIDYVLASIYQPKSKTPFKETKFTRKQIDTWHKKFIKTADDILVKKVAKYKVGDWCTYCNAKGICEAYSKSLKEEGVLTIIDDTLPEVSKISDETLVKILLAEDKVEGIYKSIKAYAINRIKFGNPINGLKLVETRKRRAWHENEEQIGLSLVSIGVKEPFNQKLKGITEVERELTKLKGKKEAIEILNNHCDLKSGGLSLVGSDDPRPAIAGQIGEIE